MPHKLPHKLSLWGNLFFMAIGYTYRFELRKDRQNQKGECPIHLIVQYGGQRKRIGTDQKIYAHYWDKVKGEPLFISDKVIKKEYGKTALLSQIEVESIKASMYSTKKEISDLADILIKSGESHSLTDLVGLYKERQATDNSPIIIKQSKKSAISFIEQFCEDNETRANPDLKKSKRTILTYTNVVGNLKEFQKYNPRYKATFSNIDNAFLNAFTEWLITQKKVNDVTASKKISILKTLLSFATQRKYGYNIKDVNTDYKEFTIKRSDSQYEVVALEEHEYQNITNLQLTGTIDKVRDIFVFSCNTGLRVSDLVDLKRSHVKGNIIEKVAYKTKDRLQIPLSNKAKEILDKYRNNITPLPVISEQRMNDYLKEIGKRAGIIGEVEKIRYYGGKAKVITQPKYERLTMHVGRKTFVSMSLAKGVPVTEVKALTGHKTLKAFQRYIDVSEKQKKNAIKQAFDNIG